MASAFDLSLCREALYAAFQPPPPVKTQSREAEAEERQDAGVGDLHVIVRNVIGILGPVTGRWIIGIPRVWNSIMRPIWYRWVPAGPIHIWWRVWGVDLVSIFDYHLCILRIESTNNISIVLLARGTGIVGTEGTACLEGEKADRRL